MSLRDRINRLKQLEMELLNRVYAENTAILDKISRLNRIRTLLTMPATSLLMRGVNIMDLAQQARMLEAEIERERRIVTELIRRRQQVAQEILMLESQVAGYAPIAEEMVAGAEERIRRERIEYLMQELREALRRGDSATARAIREQLKSLGVWWV